MYGCDLQKKDVIYEQVATPEDYVCEVAVFHRFSQAEFRSRGKQLPFWGDPG
jgi:hypothetical protein